MLQAIIRRLKRGKRGISTVIVVMLSLVLIVIIVGNVVLWSYQMNQVDMDRMQETLSLTNVERPRSPWFTAQNEFSINMGSRLSGNYMSTTSLDGLCETFREEPQGGGSGVYIPSNYVLGGSTSYVSGGIADLSSNNGVYMTFRGYNSGTSVQTLYTHQETVTIGGTPYYNLSSNSADASGLSLTASMGSPTRVLFGKSVYSLQGVSSIPASTWTVNYRAWQDATATTVTFDSASSVEAATPATSVSWSHTTGTANNRLLVVAVSVHAATGTPTTVTGVTYGGVSLTQVTTTLYSATAPQVRTYVFQLLNPDSGTRTIAVTFAASTLYVCGATTYANVDQSAPIQNSATTTGSSTSPSVPVTVTGTGRAVFGHLGGHRTTEVTFQAAGTGSGTTGNPTPSYPVGLQADDLILLQVTVRDTFYTPTTPTGFTLLYGPDTGTTGRQWIYYRFATGSESGTITVTIGGSSCKIARMYSFRNVALSSFTEGGDFGSDFSSTINAQSVTTTDTNRLAVSFVFVNNDDAVGSFTGETGGDWTEAVSEFTYNGPFSNDGCVQLQTATMASAGTISGGSYTMSASDPWGVRAFALKPRTDWVITEAIGQNNRWAEETYPYKGRGSDKLDVAAGIVTMSWSTDYAPNWVCSAVVINPVVPVGHCDIDVLIRKLDDTIRSGIATNVANSGDLTSTATTLSSSYSWAEYSVVSQTDYLEIDYYVDVTSAVSGVNAYLRIDDNTLPTVDQTRVANVMLPSGYTAEVEFSGTSNTESWSQLVWTIDSSFTMSGVTATFQLYNFSASAYPTSGNGYMVDTIGQTDTTESQTITDNPANFRDASGNWKIKITGTKATGTPFDLNVDWIEFKTATSGVYRLDIDNNFTIDLSTYPRSDIYGIEIQIRYNVTENTERWFLKAYNWNSASFSDTGFNNTSGSQPTPSQWNQYAISVTNNWADYIAGNGTIRMKFFDEGTSTNQTIIGIDFFGARAIMDGTCLDIKNSSPLSLHIVAVWITDATSHQRWDVDWFLNSGETAEYTMNISLPQDAFMAKVITERGNTAVFSND